jgi:2-methylcitrate dehydratase PrpD
VATTLLNGSLTAADFATPQVHERRRWELAERVRVVHNPEMTRDSFRCAVPFGEALKLAGPRAADWEFGSLGESIGSLGLADLLTDTLPPSESFEDASKVTGARVTLRFRDGSSFVRERDIPLGAAGPHTRRHHAELMREKFLETGGNPAIADAVSDLEHLPAHQVTQVLEEALLFHCKSQTSIAIHGSVRR